MGQLVYQQIKDLILDSELVTDYMDLDSQLQPNGFDLTLCDVYQFETAGHIGISDERRILSEVWKLDFYDGVRVLKAGSYLIEMHEKLRLPGNVMAFGKTRTSLLRSGVSIDSGFWDVGFWGKSRMLLTVQNPCGFTVERNARLFQLSFVRTEIPSVYLYGGVYQEMLDLD